MHAQMRARIHVCDSKCTYADACNGACDGTTANSLLCECPAWADWQSHPSKPVLLSDVHCDTEADLDLDAEMQLGEIDLYGSD